MRLQVTQTEWQCVSHFCFVLAATEQNHCPQTNLPGVFWDRSAMQLVIAECHPRAYECVGECATSQSCCSLSHHISAHNASALFKMEYINTSDDQDTLPHRGVSYVRVCVCVLVFATYCYIYQNIHSTCKVGQFWLVPRTLKDFEG